MVNEKGFSILSYPNNLVIGITIIASFFSSLYIGQKSIWFDEACSIFIAKLPWGDFWELLSAKELNQGFYFLLLKFWLVLGDSEFAVRALSALFSIASIPVLYALAKRLFGVRAGLITALLLSVNPSIVEYAQEARGYALVFFLVVLSSYMFVRVTEDPSNKKMLCGYISISALAVYAHFFGALVLIAQTLSVPFLPSNKFRIRQLVLANLLIFALIIPIVLFILFKDLPPASWIPKPSVSLLIRLFRDLSGDAGHKGYMTSFYLLPCIIALIIALTHALATFFRTGRSIDTWRYAFIFFWLVVPIGLSYGFSFIKPIFLKRYLIVSLPGLVLLTGVGIALIKDKYCYPVLLILLIVLSVRSTLTEYYPKEKENFRDSTSYVVSDAQRGDGILFYRGITTIPFEYYWRRFNTPLDLLDGVYPSKLGHYNFREDFIEDPPDPTVPYLESLKDRYERIWVVSRYISPEKSIIFRIILTTLEEHYQLQQEKNYLDVRVLLFVRK
jgi:mannosyltransferase